MVSQNHNLITFYLFNFLHSYCSPRSLYSYGAKFRFSSEMGTNLNKIVHCSCAGALQCYLWDGTLTLGFFYHLRSILMFPCYDRNDTGEFPLYNGQYLNLIQHQKVIQSLITIFPGQQWMGNYVALQALPTSIE